MMTMRTFLRLASRSLPELFLVFLPGIAIPSDRN